MGALTGKVAVVTGAAGGIGGAVVSALADAGADLVGLDREQGDLTRASASTCS
jgi:NAD(P)-dependent dehydrogenase (short-subunit alcohol dehydrogenase family)